MHDQELPAGGFGKRSDVGPGAGGKRRPPGQKKRDVGAESRGVRQEDRCRGPKTQEVVDPDESGGGIAAPSSQAGSGRYLLYKAQLEAGRSGKVCKEPLRRPKDEVPGSRGEGGVVDLERRTERISW
jgi:hypothetical protein